MGETLTLRRRVPVGVAVAVVGLLLTALALLFLRLDKSNPDPEYPSQLGQDRWVLNEVFPGVKDGYFVDVGSGDGEYISNTWKLEKEGWAGVCIDPFPTHMRRRSCQLFREVVYSRAGETVTFRTAGLFGGLDKFMYKLGKGVRKSDTVQLRTVTLDDVLARARAPRFINYMSIDVEGAELEVLKGLSLERYRVGAFTIEHSSEEPKRTEIRKMLESHGYRLARTVEWDDWYLPGVGQPAAPSSK